MRSTPAFFINGIVGVGGQPFEVFQLVIERELAVEIPQSSICNKSGCSLELSKTGSSFDGGG